MRHQCMIYDGSPAKFLPATARIIAENLKAERRCLYMNAPAMVAGLRSYLSATGVKVAAEVSRGALVLSSDQGHLAQGRFDVKKMLLLLRNTLDQSLHDGYRGLFAVGDMTWEFGPERNFEKLVEYERGLEAIFTARAEMRGICQYHRETLPVDAVQTALRSHRHCYINETLSLVNPWFTPEGADLEVIPPLQVRMMVANGGAQADS